jgi:hypothetical protein
MRHSNASNYWGTQIAWGWEDNANKLATRNVSSGTFGSWVYYLNSSNYTSYAPSLTGSGASGTWGINVTGSSASCTGNAATATTATNATLLSNAATGIYASASGTAYSSVVCVREAGLGGSGASPPKLGWHWGGVVASSIGIESSGRIAIFNNPGTSYEALVCSTFTATSSITSSGNVTAYSDERVKTNWRDLRLDFVERLAEVKHGIYDRTDIEETQVGVSAQSLQKILEQAVMEGEDGHLSVAYGNAALVAAVKLAERVVEQDARIAKLEALVAKLVGA